MSKHIILFLAANPVGTSERALGREARAIQEELEQSGDRDRFELVTRWAMRPLDLLRALRKLKPTVVHFSGHGGRDVRRMGAGVSPGVVRRLGGNSGAAEYPSGLFFQGRDGQPQLVSTAALEETFGAAGASVRLVVLNACFSEEQAGALLAHVSCVVGMRGWIDEDSARNFAIGFYGALGDRESVAVAYRQGCAAIRLEGLPDAERPQFKVRDGIDANQIVLATSGTGQELGNTTDDGRSQRCAFEGPAPGVVHIPPLPVDLLTRREPIHGSILAMLRRWQHAVFGQRRPPEPASLGTPVAPPSSQEPLFSTVLSKEGQEWTVRKALVDSIYVLLEREFRDLTARVSSLPRRLDLDARDQEAFEALVSSFVEEPLLSDIHEPITLRADALLRQLEHCLEPAQRPAAEQLVTSSIAEANRKRAGSERRSLAAWKEETRRQHERLIPFFPDAIGEILDRVYVEIYVEQFADSQFSAVTTLFELLLDAFKGERYSSPVSPGTDEPESSEADTTSHEAGRWVILGDPGSGKTTLARHVAWRLAAMADAPVPLYLSLTRLVASGRHPFAEAEAELVEAVGPAGRGLEDALFRAAKYMGGVCLMLDGFDEVLPSAVVSVRNRIRSWAYELPYVAIAVLTRPIGYQTLEPMFRHARVLPLGPPAQQELLKRWCPHPVAERTWQRLHERGTRLRTIISNPLMLTLVAVLAREQESLPLNRVQLYAQAINLLLSRGHYAEHRGVKDRIAARRILGLLSYALQQKPMEIWSKSQLHDSLVKLSAERPENRALLEPWGSPEEFLDDVARNSGVLGAHDGSREPWRFLHRSLREFLVAEMLSAKFAAEEHGRSAEDMMIEELKGVDRDSIGRWGEPLSLLCGLVPRPLFLLKRVREVHPNLAWRALLNADTLDPFDAVRFIGGGDWQSHIKQIAKTWIATGEEDDIRRAKQLLWLMVDPARPVTDVSIVYQALEEVGLPPDHEEFFSRAGRPMRGNSLFMVQIPAGRFLMGLCHPDMTCPWDVAPMEHTVDPFEMSSTPITLRQYLSFDTSTGLGESNFTKEEVLDLPVTGLSWNEAYLFARWLGCDLPTEIQWEYACRGGTTTTFCSGDQQDDLDSVGWYSGNSGGRMHPVGRKSPNQFGLYDMHGNVWEWCADWSRLPESQINYVDDYHDCKVLRGGSWFNESRRARSAERSRWPADRGYRLIGFRVVRR